MKTKIEILRKVVVLSGLMNDNEFTEKHNNDEFNIYLEAMEEWEQVFIPEYNSFEEASEPLMKWLADNEHPNVMAEVISNKSVLWEGKASHVTEKFIVD